MKALGRASVSGEIWPGSPLQPVVSYPETVGLASMLINSRLRHGRTDRDEDELFCQEVRRTGISYQLDRAYDPLSQRPGCQHPDDDRDLRPGRWMETT
jgi:hypothetical protein